MTVLIGDADEENGIYQIRSIALDHTKDVGHEAVTHRRGEGIIGRIQAQTGLEDHGDFPRQSGNHLQDTHNQTQYDDYGQHTAEGLEAQANRL